jgi:hypothetical protein
MAGGASVNVSDFKEEKKRRRGDTEACKAAAVPSHKTYTHIYQLYLAFVCTKGQLIWHRRGDYGRCFGQTDGVDADRPSCI